LITISTDHVKTPVVGRIGVGLVAGINNRPIEGRLKTNFVFDEVSTLGKLETSNFTALTNAHTSRAADHWTRDKKGRQSSNKIV